MELGNLFKKDKDSKQFSIKLYNRKKMSQAKICSVYGNNKYVRIYQKCSRMVLYTT